MKFTEPFRCIAVISLSFILSGCWIFGEPKRQSPVMKPTADPSILYTTGGYYRYVTGNGGMRVPVSKSSNWINGWGAEREALAKPADWSAGHYWAPDVVRVGSKYFLYYSAAIKTSWPYYGAKSAHFHEHAIGVACSNYPNRGFKDCSLRPYGFDSWAVRDSNKNGAIDAKVIGHAGKYYLLWSVDWGVKGRRGYETPRKIRGCRLHSHMKSCATSPKTLIHAHNNTWERGTVENPAMIYGGDGNFHLFYSGGNFENAYATGHTVCGKTPISSCKHQKSSPLIDNKKWGLPNVGGMDFFPVFWGVWGAVFHSAPDFNPANGDPRKTYVTTIHWED